MLIFYWKLDENTFFFVRWMSTKHLLTFKVRLENCHIWLWVNKYFFFFCFKLYFFHNINRKVNQICFINRYIKEGLSLCFKYLPFSSCCNSSLEWRFLPSPVGLDVPELPVSSPVSASLSGTNNCWPEYINELFKRFMAVSSDGVVSKRAATDVKVSRSPTCFFG